MDLTQKELEDFNKELKTLLEKHKVTLTVGHQIIVSKVKEETEPVIKEIK